MHVDFLQLRPRLMELGGSLARTIAMLFRAGHLNIGCVAQCCASHHVFAPSRYGRLRRSPSRAPFTTRWAFALPTSSSLARCACSCIGMCNPTLRFERNPLHRSLSCIHGAQTTAAAAVLPRPFQLEGRGGEGGVGGGWHTV